MKIIVLIIFIIFPSSFLYSQDIVRNRYVEMPDIDAKNFYIIENDAFKKACREHIIYSYDFLMDYLTYKNIRVDEVPEKEGLREIFERVVIKKKKFRKKDKPIWKQEYYNYEYSKNLSRLRIKLNEERKIDSIKRNNWDESNLYLALKMYKSYHPHMEDKSFVNLDKYSVNIEEVYDQYCKEVWPNSHFSPKALRQKYKVNDIEDINLPDSDFLFLEKYIDRYINNIRGILDTKNMYKNILEETGYYRFYFSRPSTIKKTAKNPIDALFEIDKNNDKVKELEMLINYYMDESNKKQLKKYFLSKNDKFKEICVKLDEALEYRKNHPLTDGIYKYNSKDDVRNKNAVNEYHYVEIPYKVQGDSLVPHGTCILHIFEGQYPNADGDWYRQYTLDAKVYIQVENGVAKSKKITGFHKVWSPDKRVWDRTKGSFLQKASATLHAKPAVVRVNNLSKLENYQIEIMLSSSSIERYMDIPFSSNNVNLDDLCRRYIMDPEYKTFCLELIKKPLKKIDMSKLN